MREITVKYAGECKRCGNALDVGEVAMYEKSQGIFCPGCEPKDAEEIRHFRTLKAEVKADRLLNKADRLTKVAGEKMAEFNHLRKDIAWLTQPGHIPGRDKVLNRYDKGHELLQEASAARQKAESIMIHKTRVAGDAERQRQARRDALDVVISKGSRVYDYTFGPGEVISVHKKSYRIKFDRGFTYARDKSYVRPE